MITAPRTLAPARTGLAGTVFVPTRTASTTGDASRRPAAAAAAAAAVAPAAPTVPAARDEPLATRPDTSVILGEAGPHTHALQIDAASSLPPAFEEAAVLYANGQETAAASVIWQAIQDDSLGAQVRQGWAMLFDLYQAIGRKEDFESLAIDYSARFETSPPAWDDAIAPPAAPAPAALSTPSAVTLGEALDALSVRHLEQLQKLARNNRVVLLDVSLVRSVDAVGADLLLRVIAAFARGTRDLVIDGAASLLAVVDTTVAPGRRDGPQACWMLKLELLRLLGRQQPFEDLSIDYCVTFEVSPPSWEPMPPSVRVGSRLVPEVVPTAEADSRFLAGAEGFALIGELAGRAQDTLSALRDYAADRAEVIVDGRRLRRLDFVAAGELLNEVAALRAGGKYLIFRDMNHMVAALLSVMGIPELAEVRLRRH